MKTVKPEFRPAPSDVRASRLEAGLTQVEAGRLVGVGLKAWQHYESGYRSMPAFSWQLFLDRTLAMRE
jgi:DNA-binding XRE family transcriptional regulator